MLLLCEAFFLALNKNNTVVIIQIIQVVIVILLVIVLDLTRYISMESSTHSINRSGSNFPKIFQGVPSHQIPLRMIDDEDTFSEQLLFSYNKQ